MAWRSAFLVFLMTFGLLAFPSATQLPWTNTAEARPVPQRLPISPERLSLAGTGGSLPSQVTVERRHGP